MTLRRVLVANRGEIAVRIVRACRALGVESVVAVSDADRDTLAAREADRAVCVGPARAAASYLRRDALLATALGTGCDAVHPGYGFLAEDARFAADCEDHDLVFVGPRSATIAAMGDKLVARATAAEHGVPLLPGSTAVAGPHAAAAAVGGIGFPLLIKAAAGGGGRGIRIVHRPGDLAEALAGAAAEAQAAFGDGTLYLERYVADARHVEVQVFGDRHGHVVHLGERDCSVQRRYQKVVEEAPATAVPEPTRAALRDAAATLAARIGYEGAGTVEFVYDPERDAFAFLEMNTRIQVEHPVTEEVTGLDLVRMQLQVAAGEPLGLTQDDVVVRGHAVECRVTAELAAAGFRPSPGRITRWRPPEGEGVRVDTHCYEGYVVPPYYDSLLAKVITHAADRDGALDRMGAALRCFAVEGVDTTVGFLAALVDHPDVRSGRVSTRWLEERSGTLAPT